MSERTARFGSLAIGPRYPVRVMAAVNLSPESFYRGSVVTSPKRVRGAVEDALSSGAEAVDLGAMSTAPYLASEVTEDTEMRRLGDALDAISGLDALISVDTIRSSVAEFAIRRGVTVINDVSGLKNDERMARVVREGGASLLVMAHAPRPSSGTPITQVGRALAETLRIARGAGIDESRVVVDPGVGFFRKEGSGGAYSPQTVMEWHEWDARVIRDLSRLETLGRPICIGLSRKSFIGKILGLTDASERLTGSIAATALAVQNGADLVRTHDVRETVQAVRMAEAVSGRGRRSRRVS